MEKLFWKVKMTMAGPGSAAGRPDFPKLIETRFVNSWLGIIAVRLMLTRKALALVGFI